MPSNSDPRMRKALRVLLLLFGVFVLTSVIVIATHKNNTTSGAADKATTTTPSTSAPGVTDKPTTTAGGAKQPVGNTSTTEAGGSATSTTRTGSGPSTVVGKLASYVLFNIKGSGDDTIGRFVVSPIVTRWDVSWSYSCPKLAAAPHFRYTVYNAQRGQPNPAGLGPNQQGKSGTGVESYHDKGTLYMTVATTCKWMVKVTEFGP